MCVLSVCQSAIRQSVTHLKSASLWGSFGAVLAKSLWPLVIIVATVWQFCTFLDAMKAFDRVRYCKLFHLLIDWGLPACLIQVLISLYTGYMVRVEWNGVLSPYFLAVNVVKQGEVLSPVLYLLYTDRLLVRLASSGVGCYFGLFFVGALVHADDIIVLAPTLSAMRTMLEVLITMRGNIVLTLMLKYLNG